MKSATEGNEMARRDKETLIWLISLILRRVRASTDSVRWTDSALLYAAKEGGRVGSQ